MRDHICIGSSPADEQTAQVGSADYESRARAECTRFIDIIRDRLGLEPPGARLAVKMFPGHDFGSYYEVVCHYDDAFPESVEYAFRCERECPQTWEG